MKPKAIGYVRISDQGQSTYSLDSQETAIRHYCETNGFQLARLFREDGRSAKTTQRPELQKLLQYAAKKRHGIDFVVFDKVDRIAREQLGFHELWAWFSTRGIGVRVVSQAIEEDSAHGKMVAGMLAAVAEYDNALRAERVKTGMRAAAETGRWVWLAPYGYVGNNQDRSGPSMVPDPEVAPFIVKAFAMMATGLYSQKAVRERMHAEGMRQRNGKPVSAQAMAKLLRRPAYMGRLVAPKWDLETKGDWEPLVDADTWYRAQDALAKRSSKASLAPRRRRRLEFPLRGFVRDERNGELLTASKSRSKTGKRYAYYHSAPSVEPKLRVSSDAMHDAFLELLRSLRPKPALLAIWKDVVFDVWKRDLASVRDTRQRIEKRISDLEARRDKLTEAFLFEHTISREQYTRMNAKVEEEMVVAKVELSESRLDDLDIDAALKYCDQILHRADRLWLDAGLDQQQRFQRLLFPEGLDFAPENRAFRTPVTLSLFSLLEGVRVGESEVVHP